jgi:hypothetical protein
MLGFYCMSMDFSDKNSMGKYPEETGWKMDGQTLINYYALIFAILSL